MVKHRTAVQTKPSAKLWMIAAKSMILCLGVSLTGCTALTQPINGVPAGRLPPQFFQSQKDELVPIDVSLLSQEQPRNYQLGAGDVLGIVVPTILPFAEPDTVPALPPVNFPEANSDLPPSTGFPTTVLEDGTISLPLVDPIVVQGLTTDQVRDKIRAAYLDAKILIEDEQKKITPIVTIIKKRQISVVVIRQDQNIGSQQAQQQQVNQTGRGVAGVDYSAEGNVIQLDAFKNDVLHALMQTGGLPGVRAKNQIKILRSSRKDREARLEFIRNYGQIVANHCDPCGCPPPMPEDPTILTIPMRLPPGVVPSIQPADVILEEGDIILIETRDTEFFYTGGLLPGGQWPIPRDYDLDALGAMAMAGYGVGGQSRQGGIGLAGIGGAAQVVPPGRLYIIRKTPCKGQLAIEVDLTRAINDPRQRPIIQPGDTLILQYKPCEEAINFGVGTFFTFGIRELFN